MEKEEAKKMDVILSTFTPKAWRIRVDKEDNETCEKLEALGYIEIYSRDSDGHYILLTEKGNKFKATSSFEKESEKTPNWTKIGVWVAIASLIITIAIAILS
jgi:hypothetical protein